MKDMCRDYIERHIIHKKRLIRNDDKCRGNRNIVRSGVDMY